MRKARKFRKEENMKNKPIYMHDKRFSHENIKQ